MVAHLENFADRHGASIACDGTRIHARDAADRSDPPFPPPPPSRPVRWLLSGGAGGLALGIGGVRAMLTVPSLLAACRSTQFQLSNWLESHPRMVRTSATGAAAASCGAQPSGPPPS
jgi:hypothetical protein